MRNFSIYPSCFILLDNNTKTYILKISDKPYSIILKFPKTYPFEKPSIVKCTNIEKIVVEEILAQIPSERESIQKKVNSLDDRININTCVLDSFEKNKKESLLQNEIPWIISETFTFKKSKFIGRVLEVKSLNMVHTALQSLQYEKSIANATHNIWAYRLIAENDNDDDGEKGAGSNLSHLLHSMDVKNVLVVVSRWYGGINLGPDRFKLINSSAKAALFLGKFTKEIKIKKKDKNLKKEKKSLRLF
ncbi:hypothetical protein PCANB_002569 [Pneumocystis canis]|nr:hypothetical protein PCANB_002569 [Pneumocystis canis]